MERLGSSVIPWKELPEHWAAPVLVDDQFGNYTIQIYPILVGGWNIFYFSILGIVSPTD